MKKIIGFSICMLLITLVLPTSIAEVESFKTYKDEVELNITAGWRGKDIGFLIAINVLNHKTENVTVFINVTFDYLIQNVLDGTRRTDTTALPEIPHSCHISPVICYPDGIKFISITAEHEDKIVTRKGLSIRNLVILFK
ncbi:MAG: hypothetical protein JSW06_01795 [Thermoplasmatales archaeon]|nr:MAG: hypothetical protein JSW06_01795 [Thermoplasmatales archaeon]